MIEKESLWSRIGNWMRPLSRNHHQPLLAALDHDFSIDLEPQVEATRPSNSSRLMPWRKKQQNANQFGDGQDKILNLVETIQEHLEAQNQRSAKMVSSLTELAEGMSALPEAARDQAERLGRLTSELGASNQHMSTIAGVVSDWPKATLAQKKALESIAIQLESSTRATDHLGERLESLGQMVNMLADASSQQVECLKRMQSSAQRQETRMADLVAQQTRRFALLLIFTTIVLLAAATGVGLGWLS